MGCKCTKKDSADNSELHYKDIYTTTNQYNQLHNHNKFHTSTNNTHIHCNSNTNVTDNKIIRNETVNEQQHKHTHTADQIANAFSITSTHKQRKKIEYNSDVFNLINKIRQHPSAFATDIENAISNITTYEDKLIYNNGIVKVSLNIGEPAFKQAADHLRQMLPLAPLQLHEDIAIMVPHDESQMKNTEVLHQLVEQRRCKGKVEIDSYFKDLIKDPYTSVLLMIIDDNGRNTRKKKDVVLGKEYTKMAVTSRRIGKTFCAYLTFAK